MPTKRYVRPGSAVSLATHPRPIQDEMRWVWLVGCWLTGLLLVGQRSPPYHFIALAVEQRRRGSRRRRSRMGISPGNENSLR